MTSTRRMPAEWEPQTALWLSWPVSMHIWPQKHEAIAEKFAEITAAASRFQRVNINAEEDAHVGIRNQLRHAKAVWENIWLYDHPTNDVWCRDHGPIYIKEDGQVRVTNWNFNAWGGKFEPWDLDNATPPRIAEALGQPCDSYDVILEGGGIEVNGAGVMLTTTPVLLNPNRNPGLSMADYESIFADALGIKEIVWLPTELPNDDTDGHIDNLARFFAEDAVLCVSSQRTPALKDNHEILKARFGQVVELPLPDPIFNTKGEELPASYANYVVINGAVLTPVFGQKTTDQWAIGTLKDCFPDRKIVPIDCRLLLEEGGALHCISANEPA
ncbi:agmatine deiminase family protein [Cerasicoccus arenae]|uniref:Agmatine deiminase n=1 Tax=Cerasicoccus arenae TaxID=424488 RepID=A0A8J3DDG4_9BACT|nr:agmatine deiminase family protein [Cerasicoccus arenae]MBK1858776.1 agmatine deiminase family protein [Cerasicoccus arenae]GHC07396.1 agmatine deiminase [Cerasicoccus arenae]